MDVLFKIHNDLFTQALEDILNNLHGSDHIPINKIIDIYLLPRVKEEIKNIILETNLNTNKITEWLSTKNINDKDKIQTFISVLEENKSKLLYLSLIHHYSLFGETISTFDWKLKLICGTSELKTLSNPLLQLALCTVEDHKPAKRLYEMNKDMLLKLLEALEQFLGNDNEN